MKNAIAIFITIIFYNVGLAQKLEKSDLIGEWEFIELQDENGLNQTEIPLNRFGRNMGIEKVNRDNYIFYKDGTYKSYSPLNISFGTWYFDEKNNEINLELRIDPDDPYLKQGLAKISKKRKDGYYYQYPIKTKILIYSDNSMTLADREKYITIYRRK